MNDFAKNFMKNHGFHLMFTVILTLLLVISSYICGKVVTNEQRISTLEKQNPALGAQIRGVDTRLDDFEKSITTHIDLKFQVLNEKIEKGAALALVREALDYANELHAADSQNQRGHK